MTDEADPTSALAEQTGPTVKVRMGEGVSGRCVLCSGGRWRCPDRQKSGASLQSTASQTADPAFGLDVHAERVGVQFSARGASVEALRDLSLEAPAGSFTVLIGPNGCGKSTFLRLVAGLLRPRGGLDCRGGNASPRRRSARRPRLPAAPAASLAVDARECRAPARAARRLDCGEPRSGARGARARWPGCCGAAATRGSCRAACSNAPPLLER